MMLYVKTFSMSASGRTGLRTINPSYNLLLMTKDNVGKDNKISSSSALPVPS
jgi:hypothetical protein